MLCFSLYLPCLSCSCVANTSAINYDQLTVVKVQIHQRGKAQTKWAEWSGLGRLVPVCWTHLRLEQRGVDWDGWCPCAGHTCVRSGGQWIGTVDTCLLDTQDTPGHSCVQSEKALGRGGWYPCAGTVGALLLDCVRSVVEQCVSQEGLQPGARPITQGP